MSRWPYNTARWRRLRGLQLSQHPMCRYCADLGVLTPATDVDHVVPVREAPEGAFDPGNLQSLCKPCHSQTKQREERSGQASGCLPDGTPRRGWA